MKRRCFVRTVGVASVIGLAGCAGNDDGTPTRVTDSDGPATSGTPREPTDSATPTPREGPPTLDTFRYPAGASRDGIDGSELSDTHESTIAEAGSLTFTLDRTTVREGSEFGKTVTNEVDGDDLYREVDSGPDEAAYVWSPADEAVAYRRIESGSAMAYRIDIQPPELDQATGEGPVRNYLSGTAWGEATEVIGIEDGADYGVRYDAVGHSDRIFGGEVEDYEATTTVAETGYVRELHPSYTLVAGPEPEEIDLSLTLSSVGDTSIEEPDWVETAREEGVRFDVALTDDRTAFDLELVNGGPLERYPRVVLQDERGGDQRTVERQLSVGDRLYVGLSESHDLLVDADASPADARQLHGFTAISIVTTVPVFEYGRRVD